MTLRVADAIAGVHGHIIRGYSFQFVFARSFYIFLAAQAASSVAVASHAKWCYPSTWVSFREFWSRVCRIVCTGERLPCGL